jgi:hypothetical protein
MKRVEGKAPLFRCFRSQGPPTSDTPDTQEAEAEAEAETTELGEASFLLPTDTSQQPTHQTTLKERYMQAAADPTVFACLVSLLAAQLTDSPPADCMCDEVTSLGYRYLA